MCVLLIIICVCINVCNIINDIIINNNNMYNINESNNNVKLCSNVCSNVCVCVCIMCGNNNNDNIIIIINVCVMKVCVLMCMW